MTSPVCCRTGSGSLRCLLAGADHGRTGRFRAMGTWLGVNEAGMAVAVTNRSDGELAWADQTRSRGLLAVDLLGLRPAGGRRRASPGPSWPSGGFGGCNYLIAGRDAAFVVQAPGAGRISVVALDARNPRHDQPRPRRRRRPEDPPGPARPSTRATSRPRRRASAATSGSSSPAPSGARSPPA